VSDLIDTTEMYLRTVYELREEGIVPLRARIAERLAQSGPTVSQTVARMERDGLLEVREDRHIELTPAGEQLATRVMRKHRLAERLLADVIGMEWQDVHDEACRWEHVISDEAERRLLILLDNPTESPFGNPIPGLAELDGTAPRPAPPQGVPVSRIATHLPSRHRVVRIAEALQEQSGVMLRLRSAGVRPGRTATVVRVSGGLVRIEDLDGAVDLSEQQAGQIFVAEDGS